MTNLAARNEEIKLQVLHSLQLVYCPLACLPLQEDINDIVVGMKTCLTNSTECSSHSVGSGKENISTEISEGRPSISKPEVETDLKALSLSSSRKWSSSSVGGSERVSRRVARLVSVIRGNGGDVEGMETELTGLTMYKTQ